MNTPRRITFLCLVSFAIGGAAGWLGRGSFSSGASTPAVPVAARPATAADLTPTRPQGAAASAARETASSMDAGVPPRGRDATLERLQALVWFKRNGLESLNLPVFGADGLDPKFVQAFGLSASETAALNEDIRHARGEILAMTRAAATVSADPEKGLVTVNVPSLPGKGGQVYDELLAQFRSVLGSDRFEQFDAVAGQSFERGLDSFGAEGAKYELTPRTDPQGRRVFEVKRSFSMPGSSGWSGGTVYADDLAKMYPVLSGLVPPELKPVPPAAK